MKIVVVSTGLDVRTRHVGIASVAAQLGVEVEHRWVDAAEQSPPKGCAENLRELVRDLPPETVVVWMDLDDWLPHRRVLARVAEAHADGAWVTYGSFVTSAGERGFTAPYQTDDYRGSRWLASHLKSFRAGLLQRIPETHLKLATRAPDGTVATAWVDRAVDCAIMWAVLEQAGQRRSVHLRDVLCVYNYASSFEKNATDAERAREKAIESAVRKMPPLSLLGKLDEPGPSKVRQPPKTIGIQPRPEWERLSRENNR